MALTHAIGAPALSSQATAGDRALEAYQGGRLAEAAELFLTAAQEASDEVERARLANNACVLFNELGQFGAARDACRQALEIRRRLDDNLTLARTLNNLGVAESSLGELDLAGDLFSQALAINRQVADQDGWALTLGNLASVLQEQGRLREALEALDEAADLIDRSLDQPWSVPRRAANEINRAVVLERLGEYDRALEILRALLASEQLDSSDRAHAAGNLGVMYRNLGDPVRAAEWLNIARELFAAADNRAGVTSALVNLARVRYQGWEDGPGAARLLTTALEHSRQGNDREQEIEVLLHLGRATALTDRAGAVAILEEAFELAEAAGLAEARWASLEALGELAQERGDLQAALQFLERALEEIERVHDDLETSRQGGSFVLDKRGVFEAAVEVLFLLDENQAASRLATYGRRALEVALSAKQQQLIDALGTRPAAPNQLSTEELQRLLPDGATLLELFVARGVLYRWTVTSADLRIDRVGAANSIMAAVARVHQAVSQRLEPAASDIHSLSSLLLPVEWHEQSASPKRLLIAADQRLRYLPFEILQVGEESLAFQSRLQYLPSAALLARGGRTPPLERPRVLVVEAAEVEGLDRLDGVEREMEQILDRLGRGTKEGTALRGAEASASGIEALVTQGANIVHYAAHARLDEASGASSSILLTGPGGLPAPLTAQRIFGMPRQPRLVVLSACSTALGSPRDGFGLQSLVGAFLGSGATAVVASLWDVGDETAAAFMSQFYYWLGAGFSGVDALERAKRAMHADARWNHTSDWAAFVWIGQDLEFTSTEFPSRTAFALGIAALALGAALAWIILRRP